MNKYYICVLCNKKKPASECADKYVQKNKFGICSDCENRILFTDGDGCFQGTKYLSYVISSFYYKEPIKNALLRYKFNNHTLFGDILADFSIATLSKHEHIKDFDIIVPIPLSQKRFRRRGYNQSALIAEKIAEHFNIAYSENILIRTRHTHKQSKLQGAERLNNMMNAFMSQSDLTGLRLLVFDDIYTTGNTLNQAAKTLKNAGATEVVGITSAIVK